MIRGKSGKDQECPSDSNHVSGEIGFQIPKIGGFLNFINFCFNEKSQTTKFTKHTIYGKMKNQDSSSTFRKEFLDKNLMKEIDDCYKISNQKAKFGNHIAKNGESYYARGHLTPCGDGISQSLKDATYYYVNTVPMWQKINNGVWKRIENAARLIATYIGNEIFVITGAIPSNVTFCNTYINIPVWIYKVILQPRVNPEKNENPYSEGIVILTKNDIYGTSVDPPCNDICENSNWLKNNTKENFFRNNSKTGYTICCSVADFQRKVNFSINTRDLRELRYPY